jgi:hypothetical protein
MKRGTGGHGALAKAAAGRSESPSARAVVRVLGGACVAALQQSSAARRARSRQQS